MCCQWVNFRGDSHWYHENFGDLYHDCVGVHRFMDSWVPCESKVENFGSTYCLDISCFRDDYKKLEKFKDINF